MNSVASYRPVAVAVAAWLALAVVLGATGAFARLRPPGPQVIILVLTVGAVFLTTRRGTFADAVPLKYLVGVHVVRFVGVVFILLGAGGELSPLFAERAGWGDVATAALAMPLLLVGPPSTAGRRVAYLAWNTFGMLDLIVAVGTATLVVLRGDTPGMEPIVRLPLMLVPTFAVPLLFASHVVIFRRLSAVPPAR